MRGWWSVWSADVPLIVSVVTVLSWWSVVIGQCGQCADGRLVVSMVSVVISVVVSVMVSVVVSVTMHG